METKSNTPVVSTLFGAVVGIFLCFGLFFGCLIFAPSSPEPTIIPTVVPTQTRLSNEDSQHTPDERQGMSLHDAMTVVVAGMTQTAEAPVQPVFTTLQPQPSIGWIGKRIELGGMALTVLDASRWASVDTWTPDEGYTFLVIEVIIENTGKRDELPYNPLYFSIKDNEGFEYNTSFFSANPSLKSGTILKGDKVRGLVTFEIRSNSSGLVVTYEPMVIFGGYEPIRIELNNK
jgi:hypothetical protein